MNEKIREIALESGGSTYPEVNTTQLVKFAELIIRECAEVVYSRSGHARPQDLLEHFGVEE